MSINQEPPRAGVPFPELNSNATHAGQNDHQTALRQTEHLGAGTEGAAWQIGQLNDLQRRRSPEPISPLQDQGSEQIPDNGLDPFRLPFARLPESGKVILFTNRILVRTPDPDTVYDDSRRSLSDLFPDPTKYRIVVVDALDDPSSPDFSANSNELRGRLTGVEFLEDADKGPAMLKFLQDLRGNGYDPAVDHVTPLNVVLKGRAAIRATATSFDYPPVGAQESVAPVVVAVIDCGIEASGRVDGWLQGIETADNADPLDRFPLPPQQPDHLLDFAAGHGTFVAGIVQQVSPTTKVRVYRAIDSDGIGSEVTVGKAILRAAADGANIINLSLGTNTVDNRPPLALTIAIEVLEEFFPEVLVVAAAGNSGADEPEWPAAFKGVVAVAALNADLSPAPWSNRGQWVDLSTVGQGIVSTFVPGTQPIDPITMDGGDTFGVERPWGIGSGTSFAAPQVAGAVARLLQGSTAGGVQPPLRTPREAADQLKSTGVYRPGFGYAIRLLDGA